MRVNFRRWGVFNLVGLAGFLLQIGTIALLTRSYGWSPIAATAVGLELAALQNFLAHSRWTWGDTPPIGVRGWVTRFGRYQAAKTSSLAVSLAMTSLLVYAGLPPEVSSTAAVLICAIPNYLLSNHFVFRESSQEPRLSPEL